MKKKVFLLETSIERENLCSLKGTPNSTYPLGITYLDSILTNKGYEVLTKDFAVWGEKQMIEEVNKLFLEFNPDVVGISVMTPTRTSTFKVVKMIKSINPKIKIVLGGIHSSLMYKQILENFPVDAIVIGEGEVTTPELINNLLSDKKISNIKGIAYKDKEKIILTPKRELIKDLDSLPFPNHAAFMNPQRTNAFILSSRGCPFKCSFCCIHSITKRIYRKRSCENVIAEIEHIIKNFPNINRITFADDTLTLDEERIINICKEIIKRGINKKVKFLCMARIKPASEKMFGLMVKAGFIEIRFGIETGSAKMLKQIHKGITPEGL